MLDRGLFELFSRDRRDAIVRKILTWSDDQLIDESIREVRKELREGKTLDRKKAKLIIGLLSKLKNRRLFQPLLTFSFDSLAGGVRQYAQKTFGPGGKGKLAAKHRTKTLEKLEKDFLLPGGSLGMYCAAIKPKIAQVMIAIDGTVEKFSKYEDPDSDEYKNYKKLSGGHLRAQVQRFERLWWLHFFIDRDVAVQMQSAETPPGTESRLLLLEQFIKNVVLSHVSGAKASQLSYQYAKLMAPEYEKLGLKLQSERGSRVSTNQPSLDLQLAARSNQTIALREATKQLH